MPDEIARVLFLLLIFSLGFMQPPLRLLGYDTTATDFLFLAAAGPWAIALLKRQARFVWYDGYWLLFFYGLALTMSALGSEAPVRSVSKLLTQLYLLSLPVLACNLIRTEAHLRLAFRWWLAATGVVACLAAASLLLFLFDPGSRLLQPMIFHFGTLPAGEYPRLRVTFLNANMFCNYLGVSLAMTLAAGRLKWVSTRTCIGLIGGISVAAIFTISPGLGGLALTAGIWLWLTNRKLQKCVAKLSLAVGALAAAAFVPAMAVTPILHPTAPFLIHLPIFDVVLAPSGRLMIWMDAIRQFSEHPIFGRGIGVDPVLVHYQDPSGAVQTLTDAHDIYLSIAVQSGMVGLVALIALIVYVFLRTRPFRPQPDDRNVATLGLGVAFLSSFGYQGIGGSFEDSRHLWLLFGLFLASVRISAAAGHER